jgi:hypothetical protein
MSSGFGPCAVRQNLCRTMAQLELHGNEPGILRIQPAREELLPAQRASHQMLLGWPRAWVFP